jgi:tRNA 2-thiouridine synthesizing protein A
LDITDRTCPLTFVLTRLKLEEMKPGAVLEVILNPGEPLLNVPRSLKEQGHRVLLVEPWQGRFRLLVERGPD